jgi:CBS domain-containing protein
VVAARHEQLLTSITILMFCRRNVNCVSSRAGLTSRNGRRYDQLLNRPRRALTDVASTAPQCNVCTGGAFFYLGSSFRKRQPLHSSQEIIMSIGRICIREVDIAEPQESVQIAARRMHDRKVGALVVVNKAREPVGVVTDRDLSVRVLAEGLDATQTPLVEVMTRPARSVPEATPIEEAVRLMRRGAFRRLPVVNDLGKLVGIVTLDDILDLITEELREIGGVIAEETSRTLDRK